ncbi:MAG: 50S ribosomal protein L3 [Patescibacteria group bacterium]
MKYILGTKINMTQMFAEDGTVSPVTVISATPSKVTQVKSKEKDGYTAVQIGFGARKAKNISKAVQGHTKDVGSFQTLREFRVEAGEMPTRGDEITVDAFIEGDIVEVSGITKGKGFQGVVKRHGFHGGPRSHGQKHSEREPGSISGGTREGGRVPKGMKMAGRMGGDRVTVKGLRIVSIDKENNKIMISGAVPGRRGTVLEIRSK